MYQIKPTNQNPATFFHDDEHIIICGAFLQKYCPIMDKCPYHHWNLPYAWRYKLVGQPKWTLFGAETTTSLERNYCNLLETISIKPEEIGIISGTSNVEIDFNDLVACYQDGGWSFRYKIERLSTVSFAGAGPNDKFATKWIWYWPDDYNNWKPYDDQISDKIEKALFEENFLFNLNIGCYQYCFNMAYMIQVNLSTNEHRAITCRPAYVPSFLNTPHQTKLYQPKFPLEWANMSEEDDLKFVELPRNSGEFNIVSQEFMKSMDGRFLIQRVRRVQNPFIWTKFSTKKTYMQKKLKDSGIMVDERMLFHGTYKSAAQGICRHNFDWRLSGKNGNLYGQGTYFARDAIHSHRYSIPFRTNQENSSLVFQMFMAKVLVGYYTKGQRWLKRPPPLNMNKHTCDLYDSCVDNTYNPRVFVIFEADQCYPQYLIDYKQNINLQFSQPAPTNTLISNQQTHPQPQSATANVSSQLQPQPNPYHVLGPQNFPQKRKIEFSHPQLQNAPMPSVRDQQNTFTVNNFQPIPKKIKSEFTSQQNDTSQPFTPQQTPVFPNTQSGPAIPVNSPYYFGSHPNSPYYFGSHPNSPYYFGSHPLPQTGPTPIVPVNSPYYFGSYPLPQTGPTPMRQQQSHLQLHPNPQKHRRRCFKKKRNFK